jgi:hypothetical protein
MAVKVDPDFQRVAEELFVGIEGLDAAEPSRPGPVKKPPRVNDKCATMPTPSRASRNCRPCHVLDWNRCQVVARTPGAVVEAYRRVTECAAFTPVRTKNRFQPSTETSGGYRDLLVNVEFKGVIVELQICWRPFSVVRLQSHAFYDLWRTLAEWCDEGLGKARSPITTKDCLNLIDGLAPTSDAGRKMGQHVTKEDVVRLGLME